MAEPFVDIKLEDKVLRLLLLDDRGIDNKNDVTKNIGYVVNLGITKEIFFSTFKQWVYENITVNFTKHSEAISRTIITDRSRKRYRKEESFNKVNTILEKIFKIEFKDINQDFKPLLEELRHKQNYRRLFNLIKNSHEKIKEAYENSESKSLELARIIDDEVSSILIHSDRFRVIEKNIFDNIDETLLSLKDKRENPEKYKGIPTGFPEIDRATGGWKKGELTIILGRPGMGKSVLLLNFGWNAFAEKCNVIYVTIEMPFEQQERRLHSMITKIGYEKIKMPEYMSEEDLGYLEKRLRKIKDQFNNQFYVIDAPEKCDVSYIESKILGFENSTGKKVDLVIIDPLYLMKPSSKTEDPVGVISWDLKMLARKLDVPCIAASQFNRAAAGRHKTGKAVDTIDAAFSDKLSNNADNMIGITGDDIRVRLSFPKTRDSKVKDLFLERNFECMSFQYPQNNQSEGDNDEDEN